jgi:hypothetical protein
MKSNRPTFTVPDAIKNGGQNTAPNGLTEVKVLGRQARYKLSPCVRLQQKPRGIGEDGPNPFSFLRAGQKLSFLKNGLLRAQSAA